jgi:hypothetical protein
MHSRIKKPTALLTSARSRQARLEIGISFTFLYSKGSNTLNTPVVQDLEFLTSKYGPNQELLAEIFKISKYGPNQELLAEIFN